MTRFAELNLIAVAHFFPVHLRLWTYKCKSCYKQLILWFIRYLGTEKLPNRMLSLQGSSTTNIESASGEEDGTRDEEIPKNLNHRSCPFEIGGLKIISLGNLACCDL